MTTEPRTLREIDAERALLMLEVRALVSDARRSFAKLPAAVGSWAYVMVMADEASEYRYIATALGPRGEREVSRAELLALLAEVV